ncbi:hypothetical protein [Mycobacterium sp. ST-F2]|uniref:hypothetical protein n=1 Tax=Mycobacterium sp. ST-F2 TaxID=1490484 RepID=UPI00093EAD21|nr:hypothetical protein [Mycobacterium sp. ST-F2]
MADRPVRSAGGGIEVLTTDRGLPIRLKLAQRELTRQPQDLAKEILALCQLSAKRAQVEIRHEMAARGVSPQILRGMKHLATEEEFAAAKAALTATDDDEGGSLPDSWLRSV